VSSLPAEFEASELLAVRLVMLPSMAASAAAGRDPAGAGGIDTLS